MAILHRTRDDRPVPELDDPERWLTLAEQLALVRDYRCRDGIHTEFLSTRQRGHLTFLKWRMRKGRVRG